MFKNFLRNCMCLMRNSWKKRAQNLHAFSIVVLLRHRPYSEMNSWKKDISFSPRFLNSIIWGLISLYFDVLEKKIWQNHENSCWILAPFLSEAAEASQYYFFENRWKKLKCPHLLKPLGTQMLNEYWSFSLSLRGI